MCLLALATVLTDMLEVLRRLGEVARASADGVDEAVEGEEEGAGRARGKGRIM